MSYDRVLFSTFYFKVLCAMPAMECILNEFFKYITVIILFINKNIANFY